MRAEGSSDIGAKTCTDLRASGRWSKASAAASTLLAAVRCVAMVALFAVGARAYALEPGAVAPAFEHPLLSGSGTLSLASLRGKVVLVDFWASWCAPCLVSMPLYAQLREEFGRDQFEIIAISVDESADDARAFLAQRPVSFPVVHDAAGASAQAYQVRAMPSSYLIRADGTIDAVHLGFDSADLPSLRAQVRALTGDSHAAP
jgi:thiol-disulfide isomerase/thioredoxin